MKSIFILIITCFTITTNYSDKTILKDSQKCSAELTVEQNRNFKWAVNGSLNFSLILTNTTSNTTTYSLSTKMLKESCVTIPNKKSLKNNIDFDVSLQMNDSKNTSKHSSKNEITLNGGQTYKFVVTISIPEGTPYDNYSCIEVEANSKDCEDSNSAKTTLSVYVSNPSAG
jgi:hypothetical protein